MGVTEEMQCMQGIGYKEVAEGLRIGATEGEIKELIKKKKNLVISKQKYPSLIESNKEEYSIDYTKLFFSRFLKIILYLNTIKDSSDFLGYFRIETFGIIFIVCKKVTISIKGIYVEK